MVETKSNGSSTAVDGGDQGDDNKAVSKLHVQYPSGPYGVSMIDMLTYGRDSKGQLVRLFYPCKRKDYWSIEEDWIHWLPDERYVEGFAAFVNLWPSVLRVIMGICSGTYYIPLFTNEPLTAPDTNDSKKFPVIVFSHGLGQCRSAYTVVCSEMASQGFVVAAIEHRDGSAGMTIEIDSGCGKIGLQDDPWQNPSLHWKLFERIPPDMKEQQFRTSQLMKRADECTSCLDLIEQLNSGNLPDFYLPHKKSVQSKILKQFKNRLDLNRVMISGHSFGGVTAIVALTKEPRFKCGIALDPWMYPLQKVADSLFPQIGTTPLLCICMEKFQNKPNQRILKKLLNYAEPKSYREVLTVKGSVHENQVDASFMSNGSWLSGAISRYLIGPPSTTDGQLVMNLNNAIMLQFATKFLDLKEYQQAEKLAKENSGLVLKGVIMDLDEDDKVDK